MDESDFVPRPSDDSHSSPSCHFLTAHVDSSAVTVRNRSIVKNRFSWSWYDIRDKNGDLLSEYIRKLAKPGYCYCLICHIALNYSNRGRGVILRHATTKNHITRRELLIRKKCGSDSDSSTSPTSSSASTLPNLSLTDPNVSATTTVVPVSNQNWANENAVKTNMSAQTTASLKKAPVTIKIIPGPSTASCSYKAPSVVDNAASKTKPPQNYVPVEKAPTPSTSSSSQDGMNTNTDTASGHATPDKILGLGNLEGRVAYQEGIICSFIAEHSLPFGMAPKLIALAQLLAKDCTALESLAMEKQECAYKLKFGLKECLRNRLVGRLRKSFFSINLDETTANHGKKRILNIFVCFFDFELGKSVTQLFSSVDLSTPNAVTVFDVVMGAFEKDDIPISNLISISDPTGYLRGDTHNFFFKLKSKVPHIVDVGGDCGHHINEVCKSFMSFIDPDDHVSKLLHDIFNHLVYSVDRRQDFSLMCHLLNVKPVLPKERTGHSWLSLLDCCQRFDELKPVLCVFYFSWLSDKDKDLFLFRVNDILDHRNVTQANRNNVFKIIEKLQSFSVTDMGETRKSICYKLFDAHVKTSLLVGIVLSIFPKLKKLASLFAEKTPKVHTFRYELADVFRRFLHYFVQPEFIRVSAEKLHRIKLSRKDMFLPAEHILVGNCSKLLLEMESEEAVSFKSVLIDALVAATTYLQDKLPLNSSLFKTLAFLNPKLFGKGVTAISLEKLPKFFPSVPVSNFESEIMEMQSDMSISADSCELDMWWDRVFKLNRYPSLTKLIGACLSVFAGPRVEQSFRFLNVVLSEEESSLLVSTYEDYMYVKYHLMSLDSSTLQLFDRKNCVSSPMDTLLFFNMHTAESKKHKRKGCEPDETPSAKNWK